MLQLIFLVLYSTYHSIALCIFTMIFINIFFTFSYFQILTLEALCSLFTQHVWRYGRQRTAGRGRHKREHFFDVNEIFIDLACYLNETLLASSHPNIYATWLVFSYFSSDFELVVSNEWESLDPRRNKFTIKRSKVFSVNWFFLFCQKEFDTQVSLLVPG